MTDDAKKRAKEAGRKEAASVIKAAKAAAKAGAEAHDRAEQNRKREAAMKRRKDS